MTQTVPADVVLGSGRTGLAIGLRVLNLDGTEYAAFSTTGVSETSVAGTYRKAGGVSCPDAGAYIVWGTAATDYAEATVESYGINAVGSGAISTTLTFNDGVNPLDGVEVWITTDSAGTNVIAGTSSTNASGQVTFMLDSGSYYVWSQLAGYSFTNPQALTVS